MEREYRKHHKMWDTRNELNFLRNLGKNSDFSSESREELLAGYLRGCGRRSNWGSIDRNTVIQFAQEELFKEGLKNGGR